MLLIIVLMAGFIIFFNALIIGESGLTKTAIVLHAIAIACFWFFALNIHS